MAGMTKTAALKTINDFAEQIRQQIKGDRTPAQIAGMILKAQHAANLIEKGENASEDDYAIVDLEARKRGKGENADDLAKIIIAKRTQFAKASAWIEGMVSKAEDTIEQTPAEQMQDTVDAMLKQAQAELTITSLMI